MEALAVLEAVRKHRALGCNGWELRSGGEGFMFCVCLGNPVQISTCPIRLLHASETSANVPLLAFMTSWAQKKHDIIWEQLPLSHTQTGKCSNLWVFISTAFSGLSSRASLSRERWTNAANTLDKHYHQCICQPVQQVNLNISLLQPFYAVLCIVCISKKSKNSWFVF